MSSSLKSLLDWTRRAQPRGATLFAFGKLPQFGDFVSRNLDGAVWLADFFEQLAVQGRRGHEDPWLDLARPVRRIFLRLRSLLRTVNEAMFVMVESRDKHGRNFPLAIGWHARRLDGSNCILPGESPAATVRAVLDLEISESILQLLQSESQPICFPVVPPTYLNIGGVQGWISEQEITAGAPFSCGEIKDGAMNPSTRPNLDLRCNNAD